MLALSSLLMGCELLDNLGTGTEANGGAVIPTATMLEEARQLGRSPFETLQRHHELKKDTIHTRYIRKTGAIDSKLTNSMITGSEAEPKKKLAELKKAQELATPEAVRKQ